MELRTTTVTTGVVACLLGLLACGGPPATETPSGPPGAYVGTGVLEAQANEDNRFSDADLRSVVTVADAVVVVEVEDQRAGVVEQSDEDGGDWRYWQTELRVRDVVWRRPGSPAPPERLSVRDLWQRPLSGYLVVPLVRDREWFPLTMTSFLAVEDERPSPVADPGPDGAWTRAQAGRSLDELGRVLRRTTPWPGSDPGDTLREREDATGRGLSGTP